MNMGVLCNTAALYSNQDMESTSVSIDRGMNKEVQYIYTVDYYSAKILLHWLFSWSLWLFLIIKSSYEAPVGHVVHWSICTFSTGFPHLNHETQDIIGGLFLKSLKIHNQYQMKEWESN